jgi:hypothetical protein
MSSRRRRWLAVVAEVVVAWLVALAIYVPVRLHSGRGWGIGAGLFAGCAVVMAIELVALRWARR